MSLLIQGGTLNALIRLVKPATPDPQVAHDEHARLMELLDDVTIEHNEGTPKQQTLALIAARRATLLDARDDGTFNAAVLEAALNALDAQQVSVQLQGEPAE
jgi:CPA1 family monovalent cation:H+ antiporter